MAQQVALFGTSADPPTAGHQKIVVFLSKQFDQVAVWASDNPFKQGQTALRDRQHMLGLMVEAIAPQCPNVILEPRLSDLRSLNSVKIARSIWPEASFTLVIGTDILSSLQSWYRVEELFEQVTFLVIQRPGIGVDPEQIEVLQRQGARLTLSEFEGPDTSSTGIRECLKPQQLLPKVWDYIQAQQLYTASV